MSVHIIEDERHAEPCGEFDSREAAIAELKRRAAVPWDQEPNRAPCKSWKTCGREYELIEYDNSTQPYTEIGRVLVLRISQSGVVWEAAFDG